MTHGIQEENQLHLGSVHLIVVVQVLFQNPGELKDGAGSEREMGGAMGGAMGGEG